MAGIEVNLMKPIDVKQIGWCESADRDIIRLLSPYILRSIAQNYRLQ